MIIGDDKDRLYFERARFKAFWHEILAFLTGRPNGLLSWGEVSQSLGAQDAAYRGVQSVPLERIVGSVGRYRDFDRAFLPTKDSLARRWRSIARAYESGVSLPAVELYQIGDAYFVVDGHHRVSVAREKGIAFVDARVTEVQTKVPVSDVLDASGLEIKGEYVRFLQCTHLDELRPDQRIEFTIAGGYDRLLGHIVASDPRMDAETTCPIRQEEAVCRWYDRRYMPLVRIIRETHILGEFPHRTEADLYLWIAEHEQYLREQCGPDVVLEQVARHFAGRHSEHRVKRLVSAVRELFFESQCDLVTQGEHSTKDSAAH